MKLFREGQKGKKKPSALAKDGTIRDSSTQVET